MKNILPFHLSKNLHFYSIIYQIVFISYMIGYAYMKGFDIFNKIPFYVLLVYFAANFSIFLACLKRKTIVNAFMKPYIIYFVSVFILNISLILVYSISGFNEVLDTYIKFSIFFNIFGLSSSLICSTCGFVNNIKDSSHNVYIDNIKTITTRHPDLMIVGPYVKDMQYKQGDNIFNRKGLIAYNQLFNYQHIYNYMKDTGKSFKDMNKDDFDIINMLTI